MRSAIATFIISFILILSACGGGESGNESNNVIERQDTTQGIAAYKMIEQYATLDTESQIFDGIWETDCVPYAGVNSIKRTHSYHFDGAYINQPIYDGSNCAKENSQFHLMIYGLVTHTETVALFNGSDNVEFSQVTMELKTETRRGRIALTDISWDDLGPGKTETRIYRIIANRLYSALKTGPDTYAPFMQSTPVFLRNNTIDVGGLTEEEIDTLAEDILGDL